MRTNEVHSYLTEPASRNRSRLQCYHQNFDLGVGTRLWID